MNRQSFISGTAGLLLCLCAALPATCNAGPLDRQDLGRPANPSANDMLRIPGVIGMTYREATLTLQQAGLNPRVHIIRHKVTQYTGQEGLVVKQSPLGGGVALLGSSVSIRVYAPNGLSLAPPDNTMPPPATDQPPADAPPDQSAPPADSSAPAYAPPSDSGSQQPNSGVDDQGWRPPPQDNNATSQ